MVTECGTDEDPLIDPRGDPAIDLPKRRTRCVQVGGSQEKFPRWVRVLLWLGMPVVLWTGVYLISLALI